MDSHNSASYQTSPLDGNNNAASLLKWKNNVGILPGTDMKFRLNDNGEVVMIFDDLDPDGCHDVSNETESAIDYSQSGVADGAVKLKESNHCVPLHDEVKSEEDSKWSNMTRSNLQDDVQDYSANNQQKCAPMKISESVKDETSNSEAFASASSSLATCAFCLKLANPQSFCGRFCSRQCVGKHAAKRRVAQSQKKKVKKRNLLYTTYSLPWNRSESVYSCDGPKLRRSSFPAVKKNFSWQIYLSSSNAVAAPLDVFKSLTACNPLPCSRNNFKKFQLLEAVDPQNQSVISLVSVAFVRGHRLRLHFEGFQSSYDFWTNANSSFIFPCGFCFKTNRTLSLPNGYKKENFNVNAYAREHTLQLAPSSLFAEKSDSIGARFEIGDRLEAVDRQNPDLVCVATVADVIGMYVHVHFDGWEHEFDYWTLCSSNYIRPVGWCSENNRKPSPPPGYDNESEFNWTTYLKSENAKAADRSLFLCNSHGFEVGMKLEVVDPRNQILIRAASVIATGEYKVKIHFDGWSENFDVWMDADSPDLHPIFWCEHTGEELFAPLEVVQHMEGDSKCPIPGCLGHGHIRIGRFLTHHSAFGCPYSSQNFHRDSLPNRFSLEKSWDCNTMQEFDGKQECIKTLSTSRLGEFQQKKLGKKRHLQRGVANFATHRRKKFFPRLAKTMSQSIPTALSSPLSNARSEISLLAANINQLSDLSTNISHTWEKHVLALPGLKGKTPKEVKSWSALQVSSFVNQLTGNCNCGEHFIAQEIDGKAFLMLTQSDLSSVLKLKLGPSVKIFNAILKIKGVDA